MLLDDFQFQHGPAVIEIAANELRRLEKLIKDKFPAIKHVDLKLLP